MTPEELAKFKAEIIEEIEQSIMSNMELEMAFDGNNYGNVGGHVSVYLTYKGTTIAHDSVYVY